MKEKLLKVLEKMEDIKYGYVTNSKNIYPEDLKDWDKDFDKLYHLQGPDELIKNEYGVCWDQVELERCYLEKSRIEADSYFIIAYDNKMYPTHTFIVVKDNNNYYWLEHSWEIHRGVHIYDSLSELLSDVKYKFKKSIEKQNVLNYDIVIYKYDKPKYNISCNEFMKHCENGIKVKL